MATPYRRRYLDADKTDPPLGPLRGGQYMRQDRAASVHATGDRTLTHGHRILLQAGLHGAGAWHVSDDPLAVDAIHPDPEAGRVVARLPTLRLTPGHFPVLRLVASPSGTTDIVVDMGSGVDVTGGVIGRVTINCAFLSATDSSLVSRTISIEGSQLPNGAQPDDAWGELYEKTTGHILPADLASAEALAAWQDPLDVAIVVAYIGSPRVIDLVVYEAPLAYARNLAAGNWALPLHATPQGSQLPAIPGARPVTRAATADPGGGAEIIVDAAVRMREVGPVLWYQSSWSEGDQPFDDGEALAQSVAGILWTELIAATTSVWAAAQAGVSLASGANARRVETSETTLVLRDTDNVVAVNCWIYCRLTTSGPTARVRFEAAAYSIAEVAVPAGTSWAWRSAPGHLRCGLGPEDPGSCQVRARTTAADAVLEWRYLVITTAGPF